MSISETAVPDCAAAALVRARACIARELLGADTPARLGGITLHPHQQRAAQRLTTLLRSHGGAMLADATGLGKTYVALAVAATSEQVVVIAPAALADAWRTSMLRTGIAAEFVSIERLSRGASASIERPGLVIIDEAHHLRNPRTKRYEAAASVCAHARVLLVSATPLQNGRDDLVAQIALFLGDAAYAASDVDLARLIVRRSSAEALVPLPRVRGLRRIELPVVDDFLEELLALPPPLPGADEGEAGALVRYTLLRQWSSSRAALVSSLRRRLARAIALSSSLEAGCWPTRDEIAAWSCIGEAVQLALPDVLAPRAAPRPPDQRGMLAAVHAHMDGVRAVLARIRVTPDPDPARAQALAELCTRHEGARLIAFSQFAETVQALSRLLIGRGVAVAALTASGGRVAGGRLSRRDVVAQFAPSAAGRTIPPAERIDLLVTTDVLSEGLDLQRASVVVHLDLPWNPARLEQRVGRIRRLGSRHAEVFAYAVAPPAASERVLRVESRLRAKLGAAARIVGLDPSAVDRGVTVDSAPPELSSRTLAAIERWYDPASRLADESPSPLVAAVAAPNDALLALLASGRESVLVAAFEAGPLSDDPAVVSRVVALCSDQAVAATQAEIERALEMVHAWSNARAARHALGTGSSTGTHLRRRVASLIAELTAKVPRHRRVALAPLVSAAQRVLRVPLGAAGERALAALARAERRDASWLEAIAGVSMGRPTPTRETTEHAVRALIVLRRAPAAVANLS